MKPIFESIRNLRAILWHIERNYVEESFPVKGITYKECGYKSGSQLPDTSDFMPFTDGMTWGYERDEHVWFSFKLQVPEHLKGKEIKLSIRTQIEGWDAVNPQFIAYVDGKIKQGLDTNHTYLMLGGKDSYDIMLYSYSGMNAERHNLRLYVDAIVENPDVKEFYYNLKVPFQALEFLPENTYEYQNIVAILEKIG